MKHIVGFALFAVASLPCFATKDFVQLLSADGHLEGLPSVYAPAFLRVAFSPEGSDAPPIAGIKLALGKKEVLVPPCVTNRLLTRQANDIWVATSWDPEERHQLGVTFFDPGRENEPFRSSYMLGFDLRAARLVSMEVNVLGNDGRSLEIIPVDLGALCPASERGAGQ